MAETNVLSLPAPGFSIGIIRFSVMVPALTYFVILMLYVLGASSVTAKCDTENIFPLVQQLDTVWSRSLVAILP